MIWNDFDFGMTKTESVLNQFGGPDVSGNTKKI